MGVNISNELSILVNEAICIQSKNFCLVSLHCSLCLGLVALIIITVCIQDAPSLSHRVPAIPTRVNEKNSILIVYCLLFIEKCCCEFYWKGERICIYCWYTPAIKVCRESARSIRGASPGTARNNVQITNRNTSLESSPRGKLRVICLQMGHQALFCIRR